MQHRWGSRRAGQGVAQAGQQGAPTACGLRGWPVRVRDLATLEQAGHRLRSRRAVVDSQAIGGPREDRSARRDDVGAAVQVGRSHRGACARRSRRGRARSGTQPRGRRARMPQRAPPFEGAAAAKRHRLRRQERVDGGAPALAGHAEDGARGAADRPAGVHLRGQVSILFG